MTDDPAILALLAEARVQFAAGLPAKAAELESLVARGGWEDARRSAHKLRGSSGTYGFAALSEAAAEVEEALIEAGATPDEAARQRVVGLVRAVAAQVEQAVAFQGHP
jgi:HPt (histidine-containing phosphotransfer) domain-containing protein